MEVTCICTALCAARSVCYASGRTGCAALPSDNRLTKRRWTVQRAQRDPLWLHVASTKVQHRVEQQLRNRLTTWPDVPARLRVVARDPELLPWADLLTALHQYGVLSGTEYAALSTMTARRVRHDAVWRYTGTAADLAADAAVVQALLRRPAWLRLHQTWLRLLGRV
jgi:hypothetical protein